MILLTGETILGSLTHRFTGSMWLGVCASDALGVNTEVDSLLVWNRDSSFFAMVIALFYLTKFFLFVADLV